MSEIVKIGKWDVPKDLYDEYVKFRIFADAYALKKDDPTRIVPMSEYERSQRWLLCVGKAMELHREICKAIGIPYTENADDAFYKAFIDQTSKDAKLKG